MNTSELTGAALDWAVLEAQKPELKNPGRASVGTFGPLFGKGYKYPAWGTRKYAPSADWAQGGPIIEREKVQLTYNDGAEWGAYIWTGENFAGWGPTPLIAAMRCFVASKLGDEVDIPEELLTS